MLRSLDEYQAHQKKYLKEHGVKDHVVLLLNPEAVAPIIKRLARIAWDWVVWDEAQRLKNRSSVSSRNAYQLSKKAKRRLALSGTPMDKDPKDLWAIMRFIQPDVLGTRWKDFEKEFLEAPVFSWDDMKKLGVIARKKAMLEYQIAKKNAPVREDKLDELAELLSPYVMRITKEDAGITRAKVIPVKFNLDPRERRRYDKMERSMLIKEDGKVIKAPLAIVKIGKLQQMTGGHIKDEDGDVHELGTSKRRRLRKAIKIHSIPDEPFVVFAKYVWEVHLIHRLLKRMGYGNVGKLWGKFKDTKADPKRTKLLLDFQEGKYDAIVCQQKTGGVGVDLYRARRFFVYSMGHSFIDWDQMVSRGDFLFADDRAKFFLLMARSSIDIDIYKSVSGKKSTSENFYDRLTSDMKGTKTMAKKKKEKKAKKEKVEKVEFEYGVPELAEELDLKPASVRVQLRNHGIEKEGKSYGWNTKKEMMAVADQIRSSKDDDDGEEKPKKKKKSKKKSKK